MQTAKNGRHDISVNVSSEVLRMDGMRLRWLYEWVVATFASAGSPPNTFSPQGAGFKGDKWLDFARGRRRLESSKFDELKYLACAYFPRKQDSLTIGWEFRAISMEAHPPLNRGERRLDPRGVWYASLVMFPNTIGLPEETCVDLANQFMRRVVDEYGYLFYMHRNRGPEWYLLDLSSENDLYPHDRTKEERENIGGWSWDKRGGRPILRDVFPGNYLGPALQQLPIEGERFIDWLRADATRGTGEPFECEREPNIVLWKPPLNQIPKLREQLYRAGLVWHHQYYYRHLDCIEPVVLPSQPPPEIMRAEFYAGRNPKLTR